MLNFLNYDEFLAFSPGKTHINTQFCVVLGFTDTLKSFLYY